MNGYYRSRHGLVLGVFKGIAEYRGWSVLLTRVIGIILLLIIAKMLGAHHLAKWLVVGFFYLLAAVLMPPASRRDLTWTDRRDSKF